MPTSQEGRRREEAEIKQGQKVRGNETTKARRAEEWQGLKKLTGGHRKGGDGQRRRTADQ